MARGSLGRAERFFNEVRTTAAIRHPGIVEIYDFGREPARASSTQAFPMLCTSEPMRPQEQLLAYALFELGRCVGGVP